MNRKKYIKTILGYLIGYYRKEKNKTSTDILLSEDNYYRDYCNECMKCDDVNQICSRSTLYRIEKGHITDNDCIYERLAHQLGKKIILDNLTIYDRLGLLCKELNHSLVNFSKTRLEKIEANIELELLKYKNVLYVEEVLTLYLDIIKNVLYGKDLDNKKGLVYLFLRDKVQLEEEKLITFLLYKTTFRILNFYCTISVINEQCSKFYDDPLFYEPRLKSLIFTDLLNFLDGYNYLVNNEITRIDTLTKYQRYLLYCEIGSAELNLEAYEKCYQTYKKSIDLLNEFDSTDRMKSASCIYLGRTCFLLKKYSEAIDWFLTAINLSKFKSIGKDFLFLFSSLERLDQINKVKKIVNDIDMSRITSKYGRQIVTYYKMKYVSDLSNIKKIVELEDFIIELQPTLDVYGSLHKNVFDDDLKHYVTITGNYKKYHLFNS